MVKQLVRAPIYQQLNEALREFIRSGEYEVNSQFLTERQICEQFNVSRATANKALSNLVAEGVLEFKKGVGTFVRGGVLDYDLRALVSFTEKALTAGKKPSTQVLHLEVLLAKDAVIDVAQRLGVHLDEVIYYIERLRLADDKPVILEHRYVVNKFCPDLTTDELAGSLYALWTEKYRLDITGADQRIHAVPLRGDEARLLGVRSGAAGFQVISTGYLSGGVPLWWEQTLFRGDAYEFHNRLGPVQTARPAAGMLLDIDNSS
ncbi:MAG: GntR family transcriptional regulator [Anaerolineae bacterium]|nr:GntR family transcriptional regulator [Anaerolineae bacterium]